MKRNKEAMSADQRHIALAAAALDTTPVPTRIRIAPWGEVESTNGRFVVDEESAKLVIEAFQEHGTDLPIDYEHQTLGGTYASPSGQAPAAGWIKRIEAVPGDGIYAHVEWTSPAVEQLAGKQYRYLSPVAIVRKSDAKLIAVHSVALTNKPAIVNAEPIINRDFMGSDPGGVSRDGTYDASRSDAQNALMRLRNQLEVGDATDVGSILIAATEKLEAFASSLATRDAEERVRRADGARRLTPAQREFAVRLALREPDLFDSWLATVPQAVPTGRTKPPAESDVGMTQHAMIALAKSEYRAEPTLKSLTTEDAYIALCLRERKATTESG